MAGQTIDSHEFRLEDIRKRLTQQANTHFEPQLVELSLSKNQIRTQSLEELRQSLDSINEAIKNPQSFGVLGFSVDAEAGLYLTKSKSTAQFEVGILPLLLEQ